MAPTLPARIRPEVRAALQAARSELVRRYGARLVRVVLYGSEARGEAHANSDVDVLAVLRGPLRLYDEIKTLTDIACDLADAFGVRLSLQPYETGAFDDAATPFLRRVHADAVEL